MNNTYAFAVRYEAVPGARRRRDAVATSHAAGRAAHVLRRVRVQLACRRLQADAQEATASSSARPTACPSEQREHPRHGHRLQATDRGRCNFGEVFTTDGRIDSLDLTVLEDDQGFFPAYNVAPVVSTGDARGVPAARRGLRPDLAGADRRRAADAQPPGRRRGPGARGRRLRLDGRGGLRHGPLSHGRRSLPRTPPPPRRGGVLWIVDDGEAQLGTLEP